MSDPEVLHSAEYALPDRPNLGLATTRQLLTELVVRMEITQDPRTSVGDWFGGVCAAMREALPTKVLDYRTVDDVPPMSLAERHQWHYQSCNCLGDKAICCDPTCPCHSEEGADA